MKEREIQNLDTSILLSDIGHSFTYSYYKPDEECDQGLEFLKKIFTNNVSEKDLKELYEGNYYGPGVINAYLRILEVYHEYSLSRSLMPNQCLIKILDVDTVNEISKNWENPSSINKIVADELVDFFNFDIVIIPVFNLMQSKSLVVVVENELNSFKDRILVSLYDRKREEYIEDPEAQFEDISNIVHAIIQLVIGENTEDQYEDKIEGDARTLDVTNENDMIFAILQIAESKVLHEGKVSEESIDDYKHRIMDRLIAFHLL